MGENPFRQIATRDESLAVVPHFSYWPRGRPIVKALVIWGGFALLGFGLVAWIELAFGPLPAIMALAALLGGCLRGFLRSSEPVPPARIERTSDGFSLTCGARTQRFEFESLYEVRIEPEPTAFSLLGRSHVPPFAPARAPTSKIVLVLEAEELPLTGEYFLTSRVVDDAQRLRGWLRAQGWVPKEERKK